VNASSSRVPSPDAARQDEREGYGRGVTVEVSRSIAR
jgi:hypothetical protein